MTDWPSKLPSPPRQRQQLAHPRPHPQAVYANDSESARAGNWQERQYGAPYPGFSYYSALPSQAQTRYNAEHAAFQHLSRAPISPLRFNMTASDHSNGSRPSPSGSGGKRPLLADEETRETNGKKPRPSSNDGVKKEKGPKNCKECRRTKVSSHSYAAWINRANEAPGQVRQGSVGRNSPCAS
jgi:hypothetical protein